jgi:uncharacterized membrane protein
MLAQSDITSSIYIWSLILIVMVVAAFILVTWVKKKVRQTDEPVSIGYSLADLRQMLHDGQITQQEFERARGRLTANLLRQEKKKDPT